MRAAEAFQRRMERDAIKRQRDLEKAAKECAKLDAVEQARLEVAEFENRIDVLLSVHKDCSEPTDWLAAAIELPPVSPTKASHYELRARQSAAVQPPENGDGAEERIETGRLQDERAHDAAIGLHREELVAWRNRVTLARRVRAGEAAAYAEAVNELSPLREISHLGSSTDFVVHTPRLLECVLLLSSSKTIPQETKTLTASNKVSTKAMPVARFHEIYQDYLCSCILRVARELLALLPIETILITARTVILDSRTGNTGEHPVLSVAIPRTGLSGLNFDRLDASDTIEAFAHRGDFKASRKSGAFLPIVPFTPADITPSSPESLGLSDLLKKADALRKEIGAELLALRGQPTTSL